jgi:hypothetical protein
MNAVARPRIMEKKSILRVRPSLRAANTLVGTSSAIKLPSPFADFSEFPDTDISDSTAKVESCPDSEAVSILPRVALVWLSNPEPIPPARPMIMPRALEMKRVIINIQPMRARSLLDACDLSRCPKLDVIAPSIMGITHIWRKDR